MALSNSYFSNSYTFTIAGKSDAFQQFHDVITVNATAGIEYLSNYISWDGTLDFVVFFDGPVSYGLNDVFQYEAGNGLLPTYSSTFTDGQTNAQSEALTGIDANGVDYDVGLYLLSHTNGSLTNINAPLYFDPNPDPYVPPIIPSGAHDFFSIFLHETLHGFGFWSLAQHGSDIGQTTFDTLTVERDGQYFFAGENTVSLLGTDLPLATTGSRDHYGLNQTGGPSPVDRGLVNEFGNYEQNRWNLGQVDLAVLADLGYLVANQDKLPLTEQIDTLFLGDQITTSNVAGQNLVGTTANDTIRGTIGNDTINAGSGNDVIQGRSGDDSLDGGVGDDSLDGGVGLDIAQYAASRSNITITSNVDGSFTINAVSSGEGTDQLVDVERLQVSDGVIALDISGNAGQTYRLYQAAFDRTPDTPGLAHNVNLLDTVLSLHDLANGFIASAEFINLYGADSSNEIFVTALYQNVLDRLPDEVGFNAWSFALTSSQLDRADVLIGFSESVENIALVGTAIEDGIWLG